MKLITTLLIFAIFSPFLLSQEVEIDTTLANQYFEKATSFYKKRDLQSALDNCHLAEGIYLKNKLWGKHIKCLNLIAAVYYLNNKYEAAIVTAKKSLKEAQNKFGEHSSFSTSPLNTLGVLYFRKSKYDSALTYQKQGLDILEKYFPDSQPKIASSFNNVGNIYRQKGFPDEAFSNYQKALLIREKLYKESLHPDLASSYNNMGTIYSDLGLQDSALYFFKQTIHIDTLLSGKEGLKAAVAYANIGGIYEDNLEFEQALVYANKSVDIFLKRHKLLSAAAVYSNTIGSIYEQKKDFAGALKSFNFAFDIYKKHPGIDIGKHYRVGLLLKKYGILFFRMEEFDKSEDYYKKALKIFTAINKNHLQNAFCYNSIGAIYGKKGDYRKAMEYFQKALTIKKKNFSGKQQTFASSYNNLGEAYGKMGDLDKSLSMFQKALVTNVKGFDNFGIRTNPKLENFFDKGYLLNSLLFKSQTLEKRYIQTQSLDDLLLAFQTIELCHQFIDTIRHTLAFSNDRFDFAPTASTVYTAAARICHSLYQKTKDEKYLGKAFTYSEKNKAILLLEALEELDAQHFAGIPEKLIEKEIKLKQQIGYYEKMLFKEKLKKQKADSTKVDHFREKRRIYKARMNDLVGQLKQDYSNYFHLKYDFSIASIDQIRKTVLTPSKTLIEYLEGDSNIFIFKINLDTVEFYKIKKDFPLKEWVNRMAEGLTGCWGIKNPSKSTCYEQYLDYAHKLYEKLFAPLLENGDSLNEELIIVADGVINYIPFNVLLENREEYTNSNDFRTLSYLIKKFQISYANSATLLVKLQRKNKYEKSKKTFIGFAPEFTQQDDTFATISDYRSRNLGPLKWNQEEIKAIQKIWKGKTFLGQKATLGAFIEEADDYRIIHLSTHAKANNENPKYSFIAFDKAPGEKETAYAKLFVSDIYNLTLPADLVVLSACETGFGEYYKGEGIMSMARAFTYAGCRSLAATFWKADDKATYEVMKSFYQHLRRGESKDRALRNAQLDYLNNSAIRDELTFPYYWAAVFPTGDMRPLEMHDQGFAIYYWMAAAFLLILAFYFFGKKRPKFS